MIIIQLYVSFLLLQLNYPSILSALDRYKFNQQSAQTALV